MGPPAQTDREEARGRQNEGQEAAEKCSFQTHKVPGAQEMPRSKKPSPRPWQGLASVCNALDIVFSWEACPVGASELLRDQVHFTICCGMRRQVQRHAGPSPLSQGERSRAWTPTLVPTQASCSLARSGRPLSCFLRRRLLRSLPVQAI